MLPARKMHAAGELPRRSSRIQVNDFGRSSRRIGAANVQDFARGIHHRGTVVANPSEVQHRNVRSMRLFRLYSDSGSGGWVRH